MNTFLWIFGSGLLMSTFSLIGGTMLLFKEETFKRLTLPLVALSAGSLIGGAFFHMIPASILSESLDLFRALTWVALGFLTFFTLTINVI